MSNIKEGHRTCKGKCLVEFSSEVLQKLKTPRKALAIGLGIPYSTYDNYVRGEHNMPCYHLPQLIGACEYEEDENLIAEWILGPEKVVVQRPSIRVALGQHSHPIKQLEIEAATYTGKVLEIIEEALSDHIVTSSEYKKIKRTINKGIQHLMQMDLSLYRAIGVRML